MAPTDKNVLDVAQIFQTYIAFSGDVSRTAVAVNQDVKVIEALALSEDWKDKIQVWMRLREGDPSDVQIQINRAVNYVQAHRIRAVLDKVVTHLSAMDAKEIANLLTKSGKNATEFSARPLADLTKAIEACQGMTQRALGDTIAERPDAPGTGKGSDIALMVLRAMNAADRMGIDSVELVRQELAPKPRQEEP